MLEAGMCVFDLELLPWMLLDSKERNKCYVSNVGFERRNEALGCFWIRKGKETSVVFLVLDSKGSETRVWSFESGFDNVLSI